MQTAKKSMLFLIKITTKLLFNRVQDQMESSYQNKIRQLLEEFEIF